MAGKELIAEAAKRAVQKWENYAKGGLPHSEAGINRIKREFASFAELIDAARLALADLVGFHEVTNLLLCEQGKPEASDHPDSPRRKLAAALAEVEKMGE